MTITAIHSSSLLAYYYAKLPLGPPGAGTAPAGPLPPWDLRAAPIKHTDATARSVTTPYFDAKDQVLFSDVAQRTTNAGSQIEAIVNGMLSEASAGTGGAAADNHKLFGLYKALHRLDYIADMALRAGTLDGQRVGLNASFQDGLSQILSFVEDASFANLTLMAGPKTPSMLSEVAIPGAQYNYTGKSIVKQSALSQALPGVSTSDRFTIAITKAGVTTNVDILLSSVTGALTLDNINKYIK